MAPESKLCDNVRSSKLGLNSNPVEMLPVNPLPDSCSVVRLGSWNTQDGIVPATD